MSKFHIIYIYIYIALALLITACDEPNAKDAPKPPQKENTEVPTDGGQTPQEENKDSGEATPAGNGQPQQTGNKDTEGVTTTDKEDTTTAENKDVPAEYTFAFAKKEHKQAFIKGGTYTYEVTETNKPTGDTRDIRYTPSSEAIATVDNTGTVSFVTAGTVIITATKDAEGDHEKVTDSYTLYITKKPADKTALVEEIRKAINAHGNEVDLNYIDTSAITNMSWLFSSSRTSGYGLSAFNGTISKWDVSKVTRMGSMFLSARVFNRNISGWNVKKVTDMSAMFGNATAFTGKDLNCWADRIHAKIRSDWSYADHMFTNSGVSPVPTWYRTTNTTPPANCPPVNPKDADTE